MDAHRIESQLASLERLAPHLSEYGCDASAQDAARALMRYFDAEAPAQESAALLRAYTQLRARLEEIARGRARPLSSAQVSHFSRCYREHLLRTRRL